MEPVGKPVPEPRDRFNLRRALTIVERDVKALEAKGIHALDQSVLKRYKIRALPLSLDAQADDSLAPMFFTSFPPEGMPEPTPEYAENEYEPDDESLPCHMGREIEIYLHSYVSKLRCDFLETAEAWAERSLGYYNFWNNNFYRSSEPEYGALVIYHVAKGSKPHIKCIMHNNVDVDDSHLLCGELLTVIRIMLGRLKMFKFVDDMIAPVLLVSLNRRHPRVIEAYFDGQELIIRRTKPYDFTFLNAAGFKTFAQWLLGNPVGDTSRKAVRA